MTENKEKMNLSGKIIAVLPEKKGVTEKGDWIMKEYVMEVEGQYRLKVCFSLYGEDKIKECNLKIGDNVKVYFNVSSKEFRGRWFTSITAWKIIKITNEGKDPYEYNKQVGQFLIQQKTKPKKTTKKTSNFDLDSLPF